MNYYNEFDPKAAAWLRELIAAGLIPPGDVDERSITEIKPHEIKKYIQCHFFAGIAGWPLALQLAGWPADRPVWTGSCPCQSYSAAGQGKGTGDHRDLWPVFADLIREYRPATVFGEQVEAAIGFGWIDRVCADMEAENYAVGFAVLGAHSAGAPHIRQRLYWVADACNRRLGGINKQNGQACERRTADDFRCAPHWLADAGDCRHGSERDGERGRRESCGEGTDGGLVLTCQQGLEGLAGDGDDGDQPGRERAEPGGHAAEAGAWDHSRVIPCRDGKARRIPVEPALFPLAHGVPGRVGLLRGAGNAIVPQVAQIFIEAFIGEKTACQPAEKPVKGTRRRAGDRRENR